jgi:deoxycytidine triphosphate deaminase
VGDERYGFGAGSGSTDMFRAGSFVAEHVSPVDPEQVQPNGVDLRLGSVAEQVAPGHVGTDGKRVGDRRDLDPTDGTYRLVPGGYAAAYAERIRVPEGHVGFVLPRSSLMRNGCMLNTAVWDAGYEGRGEGLLQVHHEITVDAGARIAQFVLAEANHGATYDGSYQGERLE